MSTRQILTAAAFAVGAFGVADRASASDVEIAGSIFWDPNAPTTAFSQKGEISNFTFDVDSVLPSGNPSTTTSFSDFEYTLNNVNVTSSLASVTFYDVGQQGMFDLNFGGIFAGDVVSIYGPNIGNIGTTNQITSGGNYLVTAALEGGAAHATGDVVVAVSAVPIPPALLLFGTAVGGLGLFGWKKTRQAVAA
jgi:hypothetical protein